MEAPSGAVETTAAVKASTSATVETTAAASTAVVLSPGWGSKENRDQTRK
jgi:hypothetical protein